MRTHLCGLVDETLVDRSVTLCGWADTRRDHGGVIFIDLRDHEGLVQVVVEPDNAAAFAAAEQVRYEFCLRITGIVRPRPASQVNDAVKHAFATLSVADLTIEDPPLEDVMREMFQSHTAAKAS